MSASQADSQCLDQLCCYHLHDNPSEAIAPQEVSWSIGSDSPKLAGFAHRKYRKGCHIYALCQTNCYLDVNNLSSLAIKTIRSEKFRLEIQPGVNPGQAVPSAKEEEKDKDLKLKYACLLLYKNLSYNSLSDYNFLAPGDLSDRPTWTVGWPSFELDHKRPTGTDHIALPP